MTDTASSATASPFLEPPGRASANPARAAVSAEHNHPQRTESRKRLAALGSRLRSFRDDQVDLEISVKGRQGVEQRVTLEYWNNRTPPACISSPRRRSATNRALRSVPRLPEHE